MPTLLISGEANEDLFPVHQELEKAGHSSLLIHSLERGVQEFQRNKRLWTCILVSQHPVTKDGRIATPAEFQSNVKYLRKERPSLPIAVVTPEMIHPFRRSLFFLGIKVFNPQDFSALLDFCKISAGK